MRSKMFVGAVLVLAVLAVGTVATSGDPAPARQSAIVYVAQPTLIGSTIVEGPVLFTHDDGRMRRGEPCTTVYLFEPGRGPAEEIASFHCIPTRRPIVSQFTMRTRPNEQLGYGCVLTEYQFAGDAEGHGVPQEGRAH
jgi:hypothetical protein